MKILLISFYFPPDLSAGSFRSMALVTSLLEVDKNLEIEVFTTTPNRYKSFKDYSDDKFINKRVKIKQFKVPDHKGGIRDQAISFLTFAKAVNKEARDRDWDIIFATSSRLMTAVLGASIAKRKKIPLYLDIRDLFIDSIKSIYSNNLIIKTLIPLFSFLEKNTFKTATKINLVSHGFNDYVKEIVPNLHLTNFTNGIDNNFLSYDFKKSKGISKKIEILYAGNIGTGQGLHKIIPAAAKKLNDKVNFKVIGDGSSKKYLIESLSSYRIDNVELIDPISRDSLNDYYKNADILFLHLNDYEAYKKVLPSKLFEYASTNKPILAGVSGFARDFIIENISDVKIFNPCNVEEMILGLEKIYESNRGIDRELFCKKYARNSIMKEMALDIISIKNEKY
tara:strand:- start:2470 stop:3654 length:1185 start_codon:yes stop_codon:yes gene_type:complete